MRNETLTRKKASVRKQMLSKTKMLHDSVVKTPTGISSFLRNRSEFPKYSG